MTYAEACELIRLLKRYQESGAVFAARAGFIITELAYTHGINPDAIAV